MMGPACYVQMNAGLSGGARLLPIAPVMLFLGETDSDEPDTAARDAATDLGQRLERPVLLLDLAARADGQHGHFVNANLLLPRPHLIQPPEGQAALQFHAVRDSTLWVSSLQPVWVASDERFWQRQIDIWSATRRRLLELFGAIVISVPSMTRSPRGLALATQVEATVLVLREGMDVAARASRLRVQIDEAGGRSVGVVMTGCDPGVVEDHLPARRWW